MDQIAQYYRTGLIESIVFLLLFLLAFGGLTVLVGDRWLRPGSTESLLARLAAGVLLASMAVGGLSGVVLNLLQGAAFSDQSVTQLTARNQAILGIVLALAVTIVGVIRIEMYHRAAGAPPADEETADWKVEPPEAAGRRQG